MKLDMTTGRETMQKMAIALLTAVAVVTVIGMFSNYPAEEISQAASVAVGSTTI